jgi:hypothetical protein
VIVGTETQNVASYVGAIMRSTERLDVSAFGVRSDRPRRLREPTTSELLEPHNRLEYAALIEIKIDNHKTLG